MAKQLADNRQFKSRAGADTGMGVTQVVNADALQGPRVTRISSRYTPTKRCARDLQQILDGVPRVIACN
jgi:hypothetical protein